MEERFNVINHLSGLTNFVFDKEVLIRIARDNEIYDIEDYYEISKETWLKCEYDLLMTIVKGPWSTASQTNTHGSFTKVVGQQTITAAVMETIMKRLRWLKKRLDLDDDELEDLGSENVWVNDDPFI